VKPAVGGSLKNLRDNHQIPNTNDQIITKIPMIEIPKMRTMSVRPGCLDIGNWNLFGI
jgi:hypothetical protein